MSIAGRFEEIVRPVVEEHNAYVIDVAIRHERGGSVAEVFIDTDDGVTMRLCEEINRKLSPMLDASSLFPRGFDLVVSSPGIERPMKFPRQYPKQIGRSMIVTIRNGEAVEILKGMLLEAAPEDILLGITEKDRRRIRFGDIVEARVNAAW